MDNIDTTKLIIINGVQYTSLPTDKIINKGGKYYLDLSKFSASENIVIEYVSK